MSVSGLKKSGSELQPNVRESKFECVPADTEDLLLEAFRLRHQVYCVEHSFENSNVNSYGIEFDQFDAHSTHSLLFHNPSKKVVGTVRLVLPLRERSGFDLPIREVCGHDLLHRDNDQLPEATTAEISRFLIAKKSLRDALEFQMMLGATVTPASLSGAMLCNSLHLMHGIVAMASRNGITHLCAVMHPNLLKMLARLGIHFHDLGPQIEHRGVRQPCFADLDALLSRTWHERRDIWEALTHAGTIWPLNSAYAQIASYREFEDGVL